ncbi:GMC family oxidoreductase [Elioraea rosea]|uniref:GMC family oxidoreductase n=1 Tax=Elioraea rosea TaxID=2492390 RepID=UPI001182A861|nr:choline dehydrogenase [Elioraea rosea]
MAERENDVIIVGAGAAGAVIAARLSEDPRLRVLLLEAGRAARGPLFSVPLMTGVLLRSRIANWGYITEPEPQLDNRRLSWPRGRALGGSTAINGMVYARGLPGDFDAWAQRGLPGWSHAEVLPYFRRSEACQHGDPALRGRDGPLAVTRPRWENPLFAAWMDAAVQAGHPVTEDFNGADTEGAGAQDFTIASGRRASTSRAFLDTAERRPNLTVRTGAQVARVIIEGQRAVGVALLDGTVLRAAREVVLAGGAINSPQLLMLSGIGPADQLARNGIAVVADLPGVGANLQDHLLIRVEHACREDVTLDRLRRPDRAALAVLRAWAFGTGPAATFPLLVGGQFRSDPALDTPDLKANFLPGLSSATMPIPFIGMRMPPERGRGFFANIFQMRPESRGRLELASADPRAHPRLMPNYLSSMTDRVVLRRGVALLRDIFLQPAFDRLRGEELSPGPDVRSDSDVDAWIRRTADTVYHPVGTCRMGPAHDRMAVLDPALRVRGIAGLRVADASVMPAITSCNTMAPTIMIAERAADLIKAETA